MHTDQRVLAVIPARGGSKGVPRKNIRPLAGKPLLAHTVDQVRQVPEIDLWVVSTDDEEIAAVAEGLGGDVVMRPAELAGDDAPTEWALVHALDALRSSRGQDFDIVVVLEPTSPLRRPETISRCIRRLAKSAAPSLLTVSETRKNYGTVEDGVFRPLRPGQPRRRQDREPLFEESSTVYVCRTAHLRETGWLVADDWLAEIVDPEEGIDINEVGDFLIAEKHIQERRSAG